MKWFVSCENAIILSDNRSEAALLPHSSWWCIPTPHRNGSASVRTHHRDASSLHPFTFKINESLERDSTTHTNTLTHTNAQAHNRQIIPRIVSNIWQRVFSLLQLSSCLLLNSSVVRCIPCSLGWIRSPVLIPHPQGPFVTYVCPVRHW